MTKTLHFVVRVTVPDHVTVAEVQQRIADDLSKRSLSLRVWRPRGRFGVWLRKMDS